MQVKIGTTLTYKGRNYICVEIEQINLERLAREDHIATKAVQFIGDNVRCLEHSMEPFETGDPIHVTGERIMLECPGVDLQFIWTKHCITKIKGDQADVEFEGTTGNTIKSPSNKAQGPWAGDSSGEGDGEKSTGEVSGAIHGDGSGGEGRDVSAAKEREGC